MTRASRTRPRVASCASSRPGLADDALPIQLSDGRTVNLYVLHALYSQEMQLKLDKGAEALLDALDRAKVREVLDPSRPPAVRRKFLGLF